jgi:4-hydroxy-3-polyprenylbenzoate decarboxylase
MREYLERLEAHGKLVRVKIEINKDTELMPLVRWQFRGLAEEERKAFLFENVIDAKGRRYSTPVAVATHAASRALYALAMDCQPEQIQEKWLKARTNLVPVQVIDKGPVQEVIEQGDELEKEGGGLEGLPIPISTPGFDPAPFITAGCWITKDPETGIPNLGTYRAQVKSRGRTGIQCSQGRHLIIHWQKARAMGKPFLEAAIVIGGPPCLGLVSVSKVPYGIDELALAGGIAGEPVQLVKCRTIDLEVPASAEIVLEGVLPTDCLEPEAPFGEYTGYMGLKTTTNPYFKINCITRRREPIYHAFLSQFPPSESSKIRIISQEANVYKFLRYDCGIPGILEVGLHEASGSNAILVIRLKKMDPNQPWKALNCAAGYSDMGKVIIAVDEDIDPHDPDSFLWALAFRMQPHLDSNVNPGKLLSLDPSVFSQHGYSAGGFVSAAPRTDASALLIDATRKGDYPPVSLPKREYMERAKEIWEKLDLAKLNPKTPWYGYSLGLWTEENEQEAELALRGEHFITGEKLVTGRRKFGG